MFSNQTAGFASCSDGLSSDPSSELAQHSLRSQNRHTSSKSKRTSIPQSSEFLTVFSLKQINHILRGLLQIPLPAPPGGTARLTSTPRLTPAWTAFCARPVSPSALTRPLANTPASTPTRSPATAARTARSCRFHQWWAELPLPTTRKSTSARTVSGRIHLGTSFRGFGTLDLEACFLLSKFRMLLGSAQWRARLVLVHGEAFWRTAHRTSIAVAALDVLSRTKAKNSIFLTQMGMVHGSLCCRNFVSQVEELPVACHTPLNKTRSTF
jgi:hypothetical protein